MENLKKTLESVVPTLSKKELDSRFPQIAEFLMKNYGIESRGKIYLLNEIEFYYYNPLYDDLRIGSSKTRITYERNAPAGWWFIHDYGVDLTFNSDAKKGFGGGILIRSIEEDTTINIITGPKNCINELWDEVLDAFSPTAPNPRIVRVKEREVELIEPIIMEKAREYRKANPGLGAAKLHAILKNLFDDTGCFPGRDAFTELLRKHGLMVRVKRRRRYRTTDSEHNYRKYPNLIKDLVPTRPNQIWASDITYVETTEGVCYLSLIKDLYSHKIVGWSVGPTLETTYPIEALNMAYKSIDDDTARCLIHHSDRGCQYCS